MEMWKTATPPMENRHSRPDGKAGAFPLPANAISHSFVHTAVYAQFHSAYYGGYERSAFSFLYEQNMIK